MLHALRAYGLDDAAARGLLAAAKRAGTPHEVRFVVAEASGCVARLVVVRRMRGNHAEAWEQPAPDSTEGPIPS